MRITHTPQTTTPTDRPRTSPTSTQTTCTDVRCRCRFPSPTSGGSVARRSTRWTSLHYPPTRKPDTSWRWTSSTLGTSTTYTVTIRYSPERLHVTEEMLSPYSRHLHDQLDIGRSTSKLVPNLQQKTGYVIHHRNLQQCVDLGMKLTALHRVLAFSQSAWLEPYIRFNTEQRNRAANPFEKDFF